MNFVEKKCHDFVKKYPNMVGNLLEMLPNGSFQSIDLVQEKHSALHTVFKIGGMLFTHKTWHSIQLVRN